ncbi:MAG: hypothetical protein AB7E72_06495 [Lysobacterales bacterium]
MATENDSSNPESPNGDMVLAYGDNGLELTPRDEVIELGEVPLGQQNLVVPATVRWLSTIRAGGVPVRLRKIQRPSKSRPYAVVEFDCTPFARFMNDDGSPFLGDWSSCCVRHLQDARHEIFSGLADRERARIARAVSAGAVGGAV